MQISEGEWEVMESVWLKSGQTAGQVISSVIAGNRSHRTLRTLLARLVKKGAVQVTVVENRHLYSANVVREECVRIAAEKFSERFFGGNVASLMHHFVEQQSLTPAEIDELRQLLNSSTPSEKTKTKSPRRK